MTAADRGRFAAALAMLAETFAVTLNEERAEAYFRALEDLPIAGVEAACRETLRTERFFPVPAVLRALVAPPLPTVDAEAVHEALRQAKRTPGAFFHQPPMTPLLQAVVQRLGGWQAVMDLSETDLHFRLRAMVGPLVEEHAARRESLALSDGPAVKRLADGRSGAAG